MAKGPDLAHPRAAALALLAAAALLTGCYPEVAPQPSPASPPVAEAPPSVETLAGEWRVAGIDGRDFNESYGLALSADERAIWWEPRCAAFVRGYRIEGNRISFGPDPDSPVSKPGAPTITVCTIAPPPRLGEVMRALSTATTVERTPHNGVLISGGGHSLLLFSQ